MSLLREAFWQEYILVILLTVFLGAGAAAAVAHGLDAALGDAASSLLGELGQYDLVVHIRQDYRDAAARELQRLLAEDWPAVTLQEGVTVAGNANFFLSVPDELFQAPQLEALAARLADVPGFNGYAWLLEPSLTVSGMRPGVQEQVAREAAALPGVRVAVRHGSSVTVMLQGIEHRRTVASALAALVEGRHVVEVRPADGSRTEPQAAPGLGADQPAPGTPPGDPMPLLDAVRAVLGPQFIADVTVRETGGESREPLAVLRDLLAALASRVRVELLPGTPVPAVGERVVLQGAAPEPPQPGAPPDPAHLIVEVSEIDGNEPGTPTVAGLIVHGDVAAPSPGDQPAFRLVEGVIGPPVGRATIAGPPLAPNPDQTPERAFSQQLEELAAAAQAAADRLEAVLALLAPEAEVSETGAGSGTRADRLARALREGDGAAAVREALLSVVLSALLRSGEARDTGPAGDPEPSGSGRGALVAQLEELRRGLTVLAEEAGRLEAGGGGWLAALGEVQGRLLSLRDDEVTRLLQAAEGAMGEAGGGAGTEEHLELLVGGEVSPVALEEAVRRATGQEVTVIATRAGVVNPSPRALLLELLRDVRRSVAGLVALLAAGVALVLDHAAILAALRRLSLSPAAVHGLGAALGIVLIGGMYALSGAAVPYVGPAVVVGTGALLGVATAALAQRLSPVSSDEIVAGQSLGLSVGQILREIVVPEGRPGVLALINRWRREFH